MGGRGSGRVAMHRGRENGYQQLKASLCPVAASYQYTSVAAAYYGHETETETEAETLEETAKETLKDILRRL